MTPKQLDFEEVLDGGFSRNFISGETVRDLRRSVKGRTVLAKSGRKVQRGGNASTIPATDRPFVAWDGEGVTDEDGSHHYVLFGNSRGSYIKGYGLSTFDCLTLLIAEADPDAIHFGFAFSYDVNMIIKDLPRQHLSRLSKTGNVRWFHYRLEYLPRKWFMVTDTKLNRTIKVWDVWTFFMCSFVKACEQYGVGANRIVSEGKAHRSSFTYEDLEEMVIPYWEAENQLAVALLGSLRENLYRADLLVTSWHGPGAIASYSLRKNSIGKHKGVCPEKVNNAAQFGYGGGRFELFKFGHVGGSVYQYDIRSAYPHAISQLPSLRDGQWVHRTSPKRISYFGIYRVSFSTNPYKDSSNNTPMPFFFRDERHAIHFPAIVNGWYWSPELWKTHSLPGVTVHEGWELVDTGERPFHWVQEVYDTRAEWKRAGNPAQLALKLQLNSLYGKMAQRVGWNEEKRTPPKWHQLEWAGWVTSYARARIYLAARKASRYGALLAVETDAVFSTVELELSLSDELGDWDRTVYEDMVYLQSGCYFALEKGEWKSKYRGFDPGSLTREAAMESLRSVHGPWSLTGRSSRFVGFRQALQQKDMTMWRTWTADTPRVMSLGTDGKRVHMESSCDACDQGRSPAETLHDLVIARPQGGDSTPHSLPWKGDYNMWQTLADDSRWDVEGAPGRG